MGKVWTPDTAEQAQEAVREALRIVMSYPNIREKIGTQVSEVADAALALSGREGNTPC